MTARGCSRQLGVDVDDVRELEAVDEALAEGQDDFSQGPYRQAAATMLLTSGGRPSLIGRGWTEGGATAALKPGLHPRPACYLWPLGIWIPLLDFLPHFLCCVNSFCDVLC